MPCQQVEVGSQRAAVALGSAVRPSPAGHDSASMFSPFFVLAARSPGRQRAFRQLLFAHVLVLLGGTGMLFLQGPPNPAAAKNPAVNLGHLLLVAGIVEGAILIGWRLTQLPKSQSLEFLLVSLLPSWRLLLAEALVGLTRLALVTLAGLPVLLLLQVSGYLADVDVVPLLVMPFTWGAVTGLGLTMWAYEPRFIRRLVERITLAGIVVYLVIGVLAGENLRAWLAAFPREVADWLLWLFTAFHTYNPFGVLEFWLSQEPIVAEYRMYGLEVTALAAVGLTLVRAAARLKGHFHEYHYRPVTDESGRNRGVPGERPLSWWAVKRVTEYSGQINLWLAAGFGVSYALYTVAGPHWPAWLGRKAFQIFEDMGGIPGLATALVVLAAVPAAFQYGLWDSNAQNRCRRLELLLLTHLDAGDYWHAAAAAAWRRGRGYFAVAVVLWVAAVIAGKMTVPAALSAAAAGAVLWGLYFVLGFRAFTRGRHANDISIALAVGVPLATYVLNRLHWHALASLLPPGSVYAPAAGLPPLYWLAGPLLGAVVTLWLARQVQATCDRELRRWYEAHHGQNIAE